MELHKRLIGKALVSKTNKFITSPPTKNQIYSMPMKRLSHLFVDSTSNTVTTIVSDMALLIEKNPAMIQKASPIIEELTRKLEKI